MRRRLTRHSGAALAHHKSLSRKPQEALGQCARRAAFPPRMAPLSDAEGQGGRRTPALGRPSLPVAHRPSASLGVAGRLGRAECTIPKGRLGRGSRRGKVCGCADVRRCDGAVPAPRSPGGVSNRRGTACGADAEPRGSVKRVADPLQRLVWLFIYDVPFSSPAPHRRHLKPLFPIRLLSRTNRFRCARMPGVCSQFDRRSE